MYRDNGLRAFDLAYDLATFCQRLRVRVNLLVELFQILVE